MIKVRATNASSKYGKTLKEFGRIVQEGEVFTVTEERFKVLTGANRFGLVLVERLDENVVNTEVPQVKEEEVKEIDNPAIESEQEPEIFVIEPGKEPVKVDKDLKPVKNTTKKATKKKKATE